GDPVRRQVPRDRPLRLAARIEDDIAESGRTLVSCPVVHLVEEAARPSGRRGRRYRPHHRPLLYGAGEDAEIRAAKGLRRIGKLQRNPEIRLVGTVLEHRLLEGDPRKRRRRDGPAAAELLEEPVENRLERREDVLLRDEAHLEVELI